VPAYNGSSRRLFPEPLEKISRERRLKSNGTETLDVVARYMNSLRGGIAVGKKLKAPEDFSAARYAQMTIRYAQAANRVAEVEALLARQKGKIAGLQRLGFHREANAAQPSLAKIETLLRLCIEDRDRIIGKPTHGSVH
jgi:hypothetical protein